MSFLTLPPELVLSIASYLPRHGLNSLTQSCQSLHTLLTPFLEKSIAGDANRLLRWGARNNHTHTITLALQKGASINSYASGVFYKRWNWPTALILAAHYGNYDAAELLLAHGASTAGTSDRWRTALHFSAVGGYTKIGEMLLVHGADIHATDWDGASALIVAAEMGHTEFVSMLLSYGPVVKDCCSSRKGTALDAAKRNGHLKIADLLRYSGTVPTYRYFGKGKMVDRSALIRMYQDV